MDNIKIGKLIAELRNKANLTQQELGDKIGVGFRAVSKWECGQTLPDIGNMKELSKIFGITLDELLSGKLKEKRKLSKKSKIIIAISSIILLTITTAIILFNTKEKTYVYDLTSVDKENYKVKGQITFSEDKISIVISELIFRNEEFSSTSIINYEYSITSNNNKLVGYGYSPTTVFSETDFTIKEFAKNFKISTDIDTLIKSDKFINSDISLNINFINENHEIIEQKIKIKASSVK